MLDRDIRQALLAELADKPGAVIKQELGLINHQRRIDLAVLSNEFNGIEIKSDADSLARLPGQASVYGTVFDRLILVASPRHAEKAAGLLPEWWGLSEARESNGQIAIQPIRAALFNPDLDKLALARMLWREEVLGELRKMRLAGGKKSYSKSNLCHALCEMYSLDQMRAAVRETIKHRPRWGQAG